MAVMSRRALEYLSGGWHGAHAGHPGSRTAGFRAAARMDHILIITTNVGTNVRLVSSLMNCHILIHSNNFLHDSLDSIIDMATKTLSRAEQS